MMTSNCEYTVYFVAYTVMVPIVVVSFFNRLVGRSDMLEDPLFHLVVVPFVLVARYGCKEGLVVAVFIVFVVGCVFRHTANIVVTFDAPRRELEVVSRVPNVSHECEVCYEKRVGYACTHCGKWMCQWCCEDVLTQMGKLSCPFCTLDKTTIGLGEAMHLILKCGWVVTPAR
jgi:hypothetical protein